MYRFLPKETIGNLAFVTYADRLAMFLWGEPHHLIFIQSKRVADSYRNQCYARAYVLKNDEWSLIYSIPYNLMQTPDSLAYHSEYKNNPKMAEPKFKADIAKLKEFTAKILF